MQALVRNIETLLSTIQETVPSATIDQIEDVLLAQSATPQSVLAKPGKLIAFTKLIESAQTGELASTDTKPAITSAESISIAVDEAATVDGVTDGVADEVSGERDWKNFDPANIETLSLSGLVLYSDWQEQEEQRMDLLNKIRSKQAATIAAREASLKSQLDIAETSRRVLQTEAQVKFAEKEGAELDALAVKVGTATMQDQFAREKEALGKLQEVAQATPTLGQVALLKAEVIQRNRLNHATIIQNSIAPPVKVIEHSSEVQTIDV